MWKQTDFGRIQIRTLQTVLAVLPSEVESGEQGRRSAVQSIKMESASELCCNSELHSEQAVRLQTFCKRTACHSRSEAGSGYPRHALPKRYQAESFTRFDAFTLPSPVAMSQPGVAPNEG